MPSRKSVIQFIKTKQFWIHIGLIGAFLIVCVVLTFLWLKVYTHHNQKRDLPDYIGLSLEEALEDAEAKSFRVKVLDSIHVVGKPGHQILYQNPDGGSKVKKNRTIYVTITKYSPDQIALSRLPVLYGKSFERKERELRRGFELESRIVGRRYDPGEPDHVLAVIYKGDTIIDRRGRKQDVLLDKGGTLEFVLSERSGGRLEVPDLVCKTYAEAKFLIANSGLILGEVITDGMVDAVDTAFVSGQVPDPAEGMMVMGQEIKLSLSKDRPVHCQ